MRLRRWRPLENRDVIEVTLEIDGNELSSVRAKMHDPSALEELYRIRNELKEHVRAYDRLAFHDSELPKEARHALGALWARDLPYELEEAIQYLECHGTDRG